jgi:glycolate oxidase FAD binding subunit
MAPYKVEALRRSCQELGGYLVVLQGPSEKPISAWGDVQSKQLIEAIKREFDPLQQLCRGRLPGVAST